MPRSGLGTASVTEAGAALADETGFHELSMGRLADRLGVRTPSLYKHVNGLADLSRRVAVLAANELADALHDATAGLAGRDALAAVAHTVRAYACEHPGRWTAVNSARPTGPDDPLVAERDRLLASFAAGLRDYRLTPDQALHALRMLRSTLHGFATLEATDGFQLDRDVHDSFAWTVSFLDHGLRALGSAPLTGTSAYQQLPAPQ